VRNYTAQWSEGSCAAGQGGYREEEGRPSMAHDRLGACGDPLGLTGAEARSSWKVWRELCWTTDNEHRIFYQ